MPVEPTGHALTLGQYVLLWDRSEGWRSSNVTIAVRSPLCVFLCNLLIWLLSCFIWNTHNITPPTKKYISAFDSNSAYLLRGGEGVEGIQSPRLGTFRGGGAWFKFRLSALGRGPVGKFEFRDLGILGRGAFDLNSAFLLRNGAGGRGGPQHQIPRAATTV